MKLFKKATDTSAVQKSQIVIGSSLDFSAKEAYKLLRANLIFSLADTDRRCKIVGVTSAIRGEGKTTTCINLAYSLAETKVRVLIIDADLRIPNVAKMLNTSRRPGLSNILTGMPEGQIQPRKTDLSENLYVITSGEIPPNPSELLGAKSMKRLVKTLSDSYDYILIDLPPVTVVSDALVVSPLCDGMLLVARQDYSDRTDVSKAVELLEYGKVKILGFVMNDATSSEKLYRGRSRYRSYNGYSHRYGKKYGYKYAYKYGYKYGYGYEQAANAASAEVEAPAEAPTAP